MTAQGAERPHRFTLDAGVMRWLARWLIRSVDEVRCRERFDATAGDELRALAVDLRPLPIAELLRAAGA